MKHEIGFTYVVSDSCLSLGELPESIVRVIDNCAAQYKRSYLFGGYQQVIINYGQKVLTYYDPSGNEKGLADVMKAFHCTENDVSH